MSSTTICPFYDAVHDGRRRATGRKPNVGSTAGAQWHLARSRAAAQPGWGTGENAGQADCDRRAQRPPRLFHPPPAALVFQDFIRTLAAIDIGPAQYSMLVVIAANPGLSQSDLADRLGIERARLVRLLDKLERRGLTQRLNSRNDRRSHALRLTREGHNALRRAKTLAALHEARLAEKFGADRRRLLIDALRNFER